MQDIFLISDLLWRAQSTVGDAIAEKVVPGHKRKQLSKPEGASQ